MSDDRSKQVYIGYLPNDARMEDVEDFFKGFGKIRSINLKPGYGFVDFEDVRDARDAVQHLDGKRMCGETVDIQHAKGPGHKARDVNRGSGRPIVRDTRRSRSRGRGGGRRSPERRSYHDRRRTRSRSRSPPRAYSPPRRKTDYALLVDNISTRCRSQNLSDAIYAETKIDCCHCEIHTPRDREGMVCFDNREDMEKVLKRMQGFELKGRKLELKTEKKWSVERSRSRSSEKAGSGRDEKRDSPAKDDEQSNGSDGQKESTKKEDEENKSDEDKEKSDAPNVDANEASDENK